ncbi:CvpA family protein [Paenibacillus qinlingensis]|uniref:Membrane protein required for colicin V production n=1 Tax=Paenibacillus qinlingensis TaxID=1837343 RepID=A0ABU1P498_9BACL|nr:CvpA family protein [Paenibacillus qinlingensis]MDR6554577.1 putative membrane protein required for colicin V production [Paenibacillus qinlingensis]
MTLNTLDYVLMSVVILGLLIGYFRGFIAQIVSISGMILAYLVAFYFYKDLAPLLKSAISLPTYQNYEKYEFIVKGLNLDVYILNAIAFALLFFSVKLALVIIGRALNILAKTPGLNAINRWSGALLGLAEALLIIVIAVNVMTIIPSDGPQKLLANSSIAPYLITELPQVAGKLHDLWKQGISL